MDTENDFEEEYDSETELQEAFAQGCIKPGLNVEGDASGPKIYANDEVALNDKFNEIVLNLSWIERLDLITTPAPIAPELAAKLEEEKGNVAKGKINDIALNDFEREMTFHRQAQAAVLEGISRLKELGVHTKRPDDYFAEMAKTDAHMQKVRSALMQKQHAQERAEKVRQIRLMRKINKQLQKQARVKKQSEKKEFLDKVKKFRKKLTDNLDFLDEAPKPKSKVDLSSVKKPLNRRAQRKKQMKETKFNYGGKRKGMKRNTKESTLGVKKRRREDPKSMKNKGFKGGAKLKNRPGKGRRMQSRKKKA